MKYSETNIQYSTETTLENIRNEFKRAKGNIISYVFNRLQWRYAPRRWTPDFPLNIDIEASSKCQLACDHCFRQYMDMGEDENMPLDMYKKIVRECGKHGLFTLKFSMRGEPLLNPNIVEMVAFAKEVGVKEVWVNTNGGNLTKATASGLLKAGVDWVTVSFDGLGKIYESVRRPFKYEHTLENLRNLRQLRDEINPDCVLNVQTILSAIKDDPDAYITLMKGLVDRVAINADMNFEGMTLVPDDDFVCPRLWQRLAITSKGNYLKCPSDFQLREILGNVEQYGVKEAWDILQGAQRNLHLNGGKKLSPVCQDCHHGAKKVLTDTYLGEKMGSHAVPTHSFSEGFKGFGDKAKVEAFHANRDEKKTVTHRSQ